MYTAFYGLDEKPFTLSPDPKYLFLSESHREVLGHLIYGIEQGEGFIAISGEVGTGKTTLCRTLLERLGRESEVAFLFNPQLAPIELLKAINSEFGLPTDSESLTELTQHLNAFLLLKKQEGRRVLLIVDEAQTLSPETLEQIRLLSNLETATSKLLQIVLLGQPELAQKLALTELRQLRQRITVWWQLGPMSAEESRAYVLHRLRIAGASQTLFSDGALAAVHKVARGVPRLINVVCDRALLAGYGEGRPQIDQGLVKRVAREIGPSTQSPPLRRSRRRLAAVGAALLVLALGFSAGRYVRQGTGPAALDAVSSPAPEVLEAAATAPVASGPPTAPTTSQRPTAPADEPDTAVAAVAPPAPPAPEPRPSSRSDVLDALLPGRSAVTITASAVDAALTAWRLEGGGRDELFMADALTLLSQRGLRTLWIAGTDLSHLQRIDLPVLVQLDPSEGGTRWALLRRIDEAHVVLQGVVPGESLRVLHQPFLQRWTGNGYVVWRDFEELPHALSLGDQGRPVDWLQQALDQLGHFAGTRSDRFDAATALAVRDFQRRADLPVDGVVGPRTKIRLYQALPGYASPSLGSPPVDVAAAPAS